MSAFRLNSDHDIYVSEGQLARAVGADFVVQKIVTQLRTYKGEWWLNRDYGVPWFQEILVVPADIENAERILKELILGTLGVEELQEFSASFDGVARRYSVRFRVLTEFGPSGEVIVSG